MISLTKKIKKYHKGGIKKAGKIKEGANINSTKK